MYKEVPVLQKCCFCLPLRGGLLGWGYLKLTIASLMLLYVVWTLLEILAYDLLEGESAIPLNNLTPFIIIFLIVTADVVLHSVFIVGCHKKNVKLLKVYYFYSVTLLAMTAFLGVLCIGIAIGVNLNHFNRLFTSSTCREMSTLFINILTQLYVILLVKSEITKLNNNDVCKFLNNVGEAEKYNLKVANLYKEKEAAIC